MIKYYIDPRIGHNVSYDSKSEFRLFIIIDEKYYWAIEWISDSNNVRFVINDLNAGFNSDTVIEVCAELEEISKENFHSRYGPFADYVERSVSGFQSYIIWIGPDREANRVEWRAGNNAH